VPRSFDTILQGGTVADHTGVSVRDIGITDGKIAEIGDLSRASAGFIFCRA
jgi:dihydroorotase